MIIALTGSHGTGKTTIFNKLPEEVPTAVFLSGSIRQQTADLGFKTRYDFVAKYKATASTIAALQSSRGRRKFIKEPHDKL